MAVPSSVTPIMVDQHVASVNNGTNSYHCKNISPFMLNLDEDCGLSDTGELTVTQQEDTMHTLMLTPTASMECKEFEQNNPSYIQMELQKYPGDYHHNIRYYAQPHTKYILYIPSIKIFFYCDSNAHKNNNNNEKYTLINVKEICISDKTTNKYINKQYKQRWIKIIGKKRIAVFVSKYFDIINMLAKYIRHSLDKTFENDYIKGSLYKFIGKNMNEMKLDKNVHKKHVIYVLSARILIYADKFKDRQKCNVLHIVDVNRNETNICNKTINSKYINKWFVVIATTRDIMFAGSSTNDTDDWYKTIKMSL